MQKSTCIEIGSHRNRCFSERGHRPAVLLLWLMLLLSSLVVMVRWLGAREQGAAESGKHWTISPPDCQVNVTRGQAGSHSDTISGHN